MTIFDEIANTQKKIIRTKESIAYLNLQAKTPRSSILSDMPKGGGGLSNPIEQYIFKKEKEEQRLKKLEHRLNVLWSVAVRQMTAAKISKQTQKMMYLRFVSKMRWEKCAKELDAEFPNCKWNINKVFREYRKVLCSVRHSDI